MARSRSKRGQKNELIRFDLESWLERNMELRSKHWTKKKHYEFVLDCPFCGKRGKLNVNASTGYWICQAKQRGGSLVQLIRDVMGISSREAWRVMTTAHRGRVRKRRLTKPEEEERDVALPEEFIPIWDEEMSKWRVPRYMRDRGISKAIAKKYGLGFCARGRYADRLIFPIVMGGELQGFQGRIMVDPAPEPKYLNPPLDKGKMLYGYDHAVLEETVALVEGPTDVLAMAQKGFPAIGLLGKKATQFQANQLLLAGIDRIIILPDTDDLDACKRAVEHFTAWKHVITTLIGWLPPGVDPGSAKRSQIREAMKHARECEYKDPDHRELRRGRIPPTNWNDVFDEVMGD